MTTTIGMDIAIIQRGGTEMVTDAEWKAASAAFHEVAARKPDNIWRAGKAALEAAARVRGDTSEVNADLRHEAIVEMQQAIAQRDKLAAMVRELATWLPRSSETRDRALALLVEIDTGNLQKMKSAPDEPVSAPYRLANNQESEVATAPPGADDLTTQWEKLVDLAREADATAAVETRKVAILRDRERSLYARMIRHDEIAKIAPAYRAAFEAMREALRIMIIEGGEGGARSSYRAVDLYSRKTWAKATDALAAAEKCDVPSSR